MADRKAIATGNWNNPAIWDGGVSLPAVGDDVYANGFTVTINQNVTCLSLRTTSGAGIVAGGGFSMPNIFDVTANIIPGTTQCMAVTATTGTYTITGTINGPTATNAAYGVNHSGTANLNVIGNCIANAATNGHAVNQSAGNFTITGNLSGTTNTNAGLNYSNSVVAGSITVNGTVFASGLAVAGTRAHTVSVNAISPGGGLTAACITMSGLATVTLASGVPAASGVSVTHGGGGALLVVNGNVVGATVTALSAIAMTSTAHATINGNVTGPSLGANGNGISQGGTGTLTVNGNVFGGTGGTSAQYGIAVVSSGTLVVNGDVTGGTGGTTSHGINITGAGSNTTVNGTATGGTSTAGAAHGVNVTAVATVFVRTAKSNNYPNGGVTQQGFGTIQTNGSGFITVDSMEDGSGGWPACSGRHFVRAAGTNFCKMRESNAGAITTMGEVAADYPAVTDVRNGTTYDFGALTGTLIVPPVGSVALGVPTDDTTGTAVLNGTTLVEIEGSTLLAMKADVTAVPAAVRADLTTELSRIDAAISTRLSSAGYTAPDNAGITAIASAIATMPVDVRAELAVELARIDATVSSRLASASYTAPLNEATTTATVLAALATFTAPQLADLLSVLATLQAENVDTQAAIAALPAPDNASIASIKSNTGLIPALL